MEEEGTLVSVQAHSHTLDTCGHTTLLLTRLWSTVTPHAQGTLGSPGHTRVSHPTPILTLGAPHSHLTHL